MSHLRVLRDELFKYRKRKKHSIDGTVPGMPYQHYRRSTTPRLGTRRRGSGGYHHEDYLGDIPTQYRPNLFSPAVDWDEYRQDHDEFTPILKTPQTRHRLDEFLPEDPMPAASSDEMSMTEQWLMNMGVRPRPQEGPVPVEFEDAISSNQNTDSEAAIPFPDGIHTRLHVPGTEPPQLQPDLEHITEALNILQTRLPEDHPDILNLRQAQKQLAWQQIDQFQQDPAFQEQYEADDGWQSNLGASGNPYENDDIIEAQMTESPDYEDSLLEQAQDFQQELLTDEMSENIGFQEMAVEEPMLEEMVEQEFMSLEQQQSGMEMPIAEAASGPKIQAFNDGQPEQFMELEVFDTNAAFGEINQAMDQAAAFQQPEMDPWKQQFDAYQQMSVMMDMQVQYMANPFGMPGPMGPGYGPMMNPM